MRVCEDSQRTIIIACEEEPLRLILAHALRGLGCRVECVTSHRALMARCSHHHYAIILTSFRAPLIGGSNVATRLRGASSCRSSLFVLAKHPSPSEVVTLLERGVDQVLTLPVSMVRLRRKIEHSLQQRLML